MTIRSAFFSVLLLLLAAGRPAWGQQQEPVLTGELAAMSYFLGDWEIEATWSWGATLKGRNEYRVGLNGRFIEQRTIVSDNGGPMYERYRTVYAHDAESGFLAHGFSSDGSFKTVDLAIETDEGGAVTAIQINNEQPDGSVIRNRVERRDAASYGWIVHMRANEEEEWRPLIDGVWTKVNEEEEMTQPIETGLFVGEGAGVRQFTKEVLIDATASELYACWTTSAGWKRVFAGSDGRADIDLRIGGRYEWLFDGAIGSNGCQVLSYVPDRMVSFSWNAPPQQAESRAKRTWVVVEIEERPDGALLRLTHLGFGEGALWDETYAYFDTAWETVLGRMRAAFSAP